MKLIESHLVLEESPTEFGFIVDEGDLGDWFGLSGYVIAEMINTIYWAG